jgi:hypothetical protein
MTDRAVFAGVFLAVEAGLAVLGVLVHYAFTAEYGNVTDTALEGLTWGLTAGLSGVALIMVVVVAVLPVALSPRPWMRVTAVAIPVLVLLTMLALTPAALQQKIQMQSGSASAGVSEGLGGPAVTAVDGFRRALDSTERIGCFLW